MKTITFLVTAYLSTPISQLMKQADLCDGVCVGEPDSFKVEITYKDGEIVDSNRIALAKKTLKVAFETKGYNIVSINKNEIEIFTK